MLPANIDFDDAEPSSSSTPLIPVDKTEDDNEAPKVPKYRIVQVRRPGAQPGRPTQPVPVRVVQIRRNANNTLSKNLPLYVTKVIQPVKCQEAYYLSMIDEWNKRAEKEGADPIIPMLHAFKCERKLWDPKVPQYVGRNRKLLELCLSDVVKKLALDNIETTRIELEKLWTALKAIYNLARSEPNFRPKFKYFNFVHDMLYHTDPFPPVGMNDGRPATDAEVFALFRVMTKLSAIEQDIIKIGSSTDFSSPNSHNAAEQRKIWLHVSQRLAHNGKIMTPNNAEKCWRRQVGIYWHNVKLCKTTGKAPWKFFMSFRDFLSNGKTPDQRSNTPPPTLTPAIPVGTRVMYQSHSLANGSKYIRPMTVKTNVNSPNTKYAYVLTQPEEERKLPSDAITAMDLLDRKHVEDEKVQEDVKDFGMVLESEETVEEKPVTMEESTEDVADVEEKEDVKEIINEGPNEINPFSNFSASRALADQEDELEEEEDTETHAILLIPGAEPVEKSRTGPRTRAASEEMEPGEVQVTRDGNIRKYRSYKKSKNKKGQDENLIFLRAIAEKPEIWDCNHKMYNRSGNKYAWEECLRDMVYKYKLNITEKDARKKWARYRRAYTCCVNYTMATTNLKKKRKRKFEYFDDMAAMFPSLAPGSCDRDGDQDEYDEYDDEYPRSPEAREVKEEINDEVEEDDADSESSDFTTQFLIAARALPLHELYSLSSRSKFPDTRRTTADSLEAWRKVVTNMQYKGYRWLTVRIAQQKWDELRRNYRYCLDQKIQGTKVAYKFFEQLDKLKRQFAPNRPAHLAPKLTPEAPMIHDPPTTSRSNYMTSPHNSPPKKLSIVVAGKKEDPKEDKPVTMEEEKPVTMKPAVEVTMNVGSPQVTRNTIQTTTSEPRVIRTIIVRRPANPGNPVRIPGVLTRSPGILTNRSPGVLTNRSPVIIRTRVPTVVPSTSQSSSVVIGQPSSALDLLGPSTKRQKLIVDDDKKDDNE